MRRFFAAVTMYFFGILPVYGGVTQSTYFDYDIGGYFQFGFFVDGLVQPSYLDGLYLEWNYGDVPTYGVFDGVYGLDVPGWGDDPWFKTSFDSNGFIKGFVGGFTYSSAEGSYSFNQDQGTIVNSSSGGYNYTYTYDFTATGYSYYDCQGQECGIEDIGQLYPAIVPLPPGVVLLLTGLGVLGLFARKRSVVGTSLRAVVT